MVFEDLTVTIGAQTSDAERNIESTGEKLDDLSGQALRTDGALGSLKDSVGGTARVISSLGRRSVAAKRAVESVGEEASNTAAKASVLTGRLESLGDALTGVSARATTAAATLAGLSASVAGVSAVSIGLNAALLGTSSTISLTVVPAVALLSTTLAPLIGVLGGVVAAATAVAGAFSAVVGSGILAFGKKRGEQNAKQLRQVNARIKALERLKEQTGSLTQAQKDELEQLQKRRRTLKNQTGIVGGLKSALGDLQDQIAPLLVQFGQRFLPLVEDAFQALPQLVKNTLNAIGPLTAFKESLRDLGAVAFNAIPKIVSRFSDLARRALPVLRSLVSGVGEILPEAFETLIDLTEEFGPRLLSIGESLVALVPPLLAVGSAVLDSLLAGLVPATEALAAFSRGLQETESLGEAVKFVFASIGRGVRSLVRTLRRSGPELFRALLSGLNTVVEAIPVNAIRQALTDALSIGLSVASDLAESVVRGITSFITNNKSRVVSAGETLGSALTDAATSAVSLGGDLVSDIVSFVENNQTQIVNAATKLGNALTDAATSAVSLGGDLVSDIVSFVENNQAIIASTGTSLVNALVSAATDAVSVGGDLLDDITTFIKNNQEQIISAGTALGEALVGALSDSVSVTEDLIDDVAAFVTSERGKQIISSAGETLGNTLVAAVGSAASLGLELLSGLITFLLKNEQQLKTIATATGRAFASGFIRGVGEGLRDLAPLLGASLLRVVENAFGTLDKALEKALKKVFPGVDVPESNAFTRLGDVFAANARVLEQQARRNEGQDLTSQLVDIQLAGALRGQAPQPGAAGRTPAFTSNPTVEVTVEGELPEESIRDVSVDVAREESERTISQRERRTRRINQRGSR